VAPSNFAATNPEFIKLAVETKGRASPTASTTCSGFREGPHLDDRRIGLRGRPQSRDTPGAVVFENE
jgi:polyhydroxyalkanoate synthase